MTRTLTALYQSRADADAAVEKLEAAGLGAHADIHEDSDDTEGGKTGEGFMAKLRDMFGGHHDAHTYAEGVRRGHFLVTAKVDDLRAVQAAALLDASSAVDIRDAEQSWRSEGWTPPVSADRVRSYRAEDAFGASDATYERADEGFVGSDTAIRATARQSTIDIGDVNTPAGATDLGTSRPL